MEMAVLGALAGHVHAARSGAGALWRAFSLQQRSEMDHSRTEDRLGHVDAASLPPHAAGLCACDQEAARRPGVGLHEIDARLAKDVEGAGVSRHGISGGWA